MSRFCLAATFLATMLGGTACKPRPAHPVRQRTASDWQGPETIDPAGDLARLQGQWKLTTPESKQYVVIDGTMITFDYPTLRASGQKPDTDRYSFLVNSETDPKVMRLVYRHGEGEPLPRHRAPRGWYYSLEGDVLSLWDHWFYQGETPKWVYRRVP